MNVSDALADKVIKYVKSRAVHPAKTEILVKYSKLRDVALCRTKQLSIVL